MSYDRKKEPFPCRVISLLPIVWGRLLTEGVKAMYLFPTSVVPEYYYCFSGSIFLIALIFHIPLSETIIKVLHIFRILLSVFWISYLQSTIALYALWNRILS